ncbi:hypothetical protein [Neopusillimonas maritima]|uniref:Uncharacterized protein n=1 Tax=Neopusillimonas maritima TaxID=2026239 RepID=A0ABX9N230_9BURK|nr:hypothetical protein [Neopusillimonas maritima]RII84349.1 hypothetical protein CJO09_03820 [Neopusillimonas maritima]
MDLQSLTVAAVSGTLGAAMTQGVVLWREARKSDKDKRYWALTTALVFERFALTCAHQLEETRLFQQSSGAAGSEHFNLPVLDALPSGVDWQALDQNIVSLVLSFPLELEESGRGVTFHYGVLGEDGAAEYCEGQIRDRGAQAVQIAEALRAKYDIKPLRLNVGWDFRGTLHNAD